MHVQSLRYFILNNMNKSLKLVLKTFYLLWIAIMQYRMKNIRVTL